MCLLSPHRVSGALNLAVGFQPTVGRMYLLSPRRVSGALNLAVGFQPTVGRGQFVPRRVSDG